MVLGRKAEKDDNRKEGGAGTTTNSTNKNEDVDDDGNREHQQDDDPSVISSTNSHTERSNSNPNQKEGFFGTMKRKTANASHASKLQAYKTKKQTQNQMLRSKLKARKEKFGVDYLDLMLEQQASKETLQECKEEARKEIAEIQQQIDRNLEKMDSRAEEINEKIVLKDGQHPPPPPKASEQAKQQQEQQASSQQKPFWKRGNKKPPPGRNPNQEYYPEPEGLAGRRK